jgi:acetyltransferase
VNLNATFLRRNPEPGRIVLHIPERSTGSAILDWAVSANVGFSAFLSVGSMLDVDFGDLIDFLGEDPYTRSIIVYMEASGTPGDSCARREDSPGTNRYRDKARKYAEAAKAAMSHTGAMACAMRCTTLPLEGRNSPRG